jgi:hypothetical protein
VWRDRISTGSARVRAALGRALGALAVLVAAPALAEPGTPVYSAHFSDALTLDNEFVAEDGRHYWDVDAGADVYGIDLYERPTHSAYKLRTLPGGSQRFAADEYYGFADLEGARAGFDAQWLYVALDLASRDQHKDDGSRAVKGLVARYGFRLALDADGAGG